MLIVTVALVMSKAFDTIDIHILMRKLIQTNISGTISKFITNSIKGRKAYTTWIEITHPHNMQFKTGVSQGGVLSPTLVNIYTSDIPPPRAPVKQHCTTHGNAPKGSTSYLGPKTHIQDTHSQHFSTSIKPQQSGCGGIARFTRVLFELPNTLRYVSPNHSQTLSNTQRTI